MGRLRLRLRKDGPIVVEGPIEIVDSNGNPIAIPEGKPDVALCRCGHSANKPFCDGSHCRCGWSQEQ